MAVLFAMTSDILTALAVFVLVSSITPGPNNMMLLASGANFGFRRTLPHWIGISVGFQSMILIVGAGLVGIFEYWPASLTVLKTVSSLYLLWLAWRIANAAPPSGDGAAGRPLSLLQAAMFQWVNPKTWTMAVTAVSLYAPGYDTQAVLIVGAAFLLAFIISGSSWIFSGQQLSRVLSNRRHMRIFNWTMAVLLVGTLYPVLMTG